MVTFIDPDNLKPSYSRSISDMSLYTAISMFTMARVIFAGTGNFRWHLLTDICRLNHMALMHVCGDVHFHFYWAEDDDMAQFRHHQCALHGQMKQPQAQTRTP